MDDGSRATFEHVVGGAHGRGKGGRDRVGVHGRTYREPEARYRRITVRDGRADVEQRTALPDRRTRTYEVAASVRGEGVDGYCIHLLDPNGAVLSETTVPISADWERHELALPPAAVARAELR